MFDSLINYLDKFAPEVLVIQCGFLVILSTLFLWLWFANRRKYHNMKHAIPANVVKNYLDSIIQNSTALKSSLFRGGGLDVNGLSGIPSVLPLQGLSGGESLGISGAPSTALLEELNQKKALIASLEAQLSAAQNSQREFEAKFNQSQNNLAKAEARIKELEALLAQKGGTATAAATGGNDSALRAELSSVTKERDEYRDRLKEFEIISDDLANLKRLQQENEQLKRSLNAQGGAPAPVAEKPTIPQPAADMTDFLEDLGQKSEPISQDDTNALEDFLSSPTPSAPEEEAAPEPEVAAAAEEPSEAKKSEKTPEDLLSEFEKMLG